MDHVTPRSRLAGWDGVCGGGPLLPGLTPSPVGVSHCIPGAALCTHRSVSDVGAAGGSRRTVRMGRQGYDGSELATGPCLCRAPWKPHCFLLLHLALTMGGSGVWGHLPPCRVADEGMEWPAAQTQLWQVSLQLQVVWPWLLEGHGLPLLHLDPQNLRKGQLEAALRGQRGSQLREEKSSPTCLPLPVPLQRQNPAQGLPEKRQPGRKPHWDVFPDCSPPAGCSALSLCS